MLQPQLLLLLDPPQRMFPHLACRPSQNTGHCLGLPDSLALPPVNLLPSSDDASLVHSHPSTLTPTQNLQYVPDRGKVEKVCLGQATARGKALGQGEGPTVAGERGESCGVSAGGTERAACS